MRGAERRVRDVRSERGAEEDQQGGQQRGAEGQGEGEGEDGGLGSFVRISRLTTFRGWGLHTMALAVRAL